MRRWKKRSRPAIRSRLRSRRDETGPSSRQAGRTPLMQLKNAVALVTGANRGLGQAFANALLRAGAAKVYAAARDPSTIRLDGVEKIRLDVTRPADVAAAAEACRNVTLLINNA